MVGVAERKKIPVDGVAERARSGSGSKGRSLSSNPPRCLSLDC